MKHLNKFIIMLVLLGSILTAAGCSSESDDWDPDRIVYSAEFKELGAQISNGYVVDSQEIDGSLYMLVVNYTTEEPFTQSIMFHKHDIVSGEYVEIPLTGLDANESIQAMSRNQNGFTLLGVNYSEEAYQYLLYDVTTDGEIADKKEITEAVGSQYVREMVSDGQGNLYLTVSDETGGESLVGMDAEGEVKGTLAGQDHIENIFSTADGSIYVSSWGNEGRTLKKADFETGQFDVELILTGMSSQNNQRFVRGGSTGLLVSDDVGIYECTIETGDCIKILDWVDSDIIPNSVTGFGTLNDKDFWVTSEIRANNSSNTGTVTTTELAILKQTVAGELPRREILTYGGLYVSSDVSEAIVRFNKSSDLYRIQIKEYNNDDYEAAMIQYNNDLTGPDCPDIIDLNRANVDQLASQGILADIYPYMEADEAFRREDYLENILTAYEKDGKLYGIMTEYGINTLVGSADKLQGIERWNIKEMLEFAGKYPESKLLNETADSIMSVLLSHNMDQFVDWDTGECKFLEEDFIRILEYAKTYGTEYESVGTREGFSSGAYILSSEHISEIEFIQVLEGMFEGEVRFIGYPVPEGSGIMLSPINCMGISDQSDNKEGAWEFFAYLLSEEQQNRPYRWSLPIMHAGLEKLCQDAADPSNNEGYSTWGYDDFEVEIKAATEQQVAQFKELLQNAQNLPNYDVQLDNIIYEETESYFAGQKTAQEVADVIQSRVEIYVNENR